MKRLITHSEDFHTDDVFATAMLLELFPGSEVIRTRDDAVIATGDIVYDVGKEFDPARGRFDHHQPDAPKRDNGIKYCGFGQLWQEYGVQYCHGDAAVAKLIDERLVTPVDANDNGQKITDMLYDGVAPFTVDSMVRMFNALLWQDEPEDHDKEFFAAVEWAGHILRRLRDSAANDLRSQQAVIDAYSAAEDKRIIVLDKPAAVADVVARCPELLYALSPRPEGTWGVLAATVKRGSFTPRKPFPETWRARPADELVQLTGVEDVVFCHATGFLAVARSRDGALALARIAVTA